MKYPHSDLIFLPTVTIALFASADRFCRESIGARNVTVNIWTGWKQHKRRQFIRCTGCVDNVLLPQR